jgi:hypothetical protein
LEGAPEIGTALDINLLLKIARDDELDHGLSVLITNHYRLRWGLDRVC